MINRERPVHIMTVEDPIEFLHPHRPPSSTSARSDRTRSHSANALKHVLRQDPDVILVGEMRDLETIQMAVTAAETGHLVFATLHTQDAAQTRRPDDRRLPAAPAAADPGAAVRRRSWVSSRSSSSAARDGVGRVVAAEVLMVTPAVRNLIREGKTHQLYSVMQAGGQFGMQTMDAALAELVQRGQGHLRGGQGALPQRRRVRAPARAAGRRRTTGAELKERERWLSTPTAHSTRRAKPAPASSTPRPKRTRSPPA